MIVFLDTSQDLDQCSKELGGVKCLQLLTPLTRYKPQKPESAFAIDNGAFSRFESDSFLSLLRRELPRQDLCTFVSVPDVVGSAIRTMEVFNIWKSKLCGWPIALVAQDGLEHISIPWSEISAIFIGGSTEWKMGRHAAAIIKAANAIGKWCHVGRVNTAGRFEYFEKLGADSIDGTGLARYSWMREDIHRKSIEPMLAYV